MANTASPAWPSSPNQVLGGDILDVRRRRHAAAQIQADGVSVSNRISNRLEDYEALLRNPPEGDYLLSQPDLDAVFLRRAIAREAVAVLKVEAEKARNEALALGVSTYARDDEMLALWQRFTAARRDLESGSRAESTVLPEIERLIGPLALYAGGA